MARWQYQLRCTNYNWGEGGAGWRDVKVTEIRAIDLACYAHLRFRRKPTRFSRVIGWLPFTGRR